MPTEIDTLRTYRKNTGELEKLRTYRRATSTADLQKLRAYRRRPDVDAPGVGASFVRGMTQFPQYLGEVGHGILRTPAALGLTALPVTKRIFGKPAGEEELQFQELTEQIGQYGLAELARSSPEEQEKKLAQWRAINARYDSLRSQRRDPKTILEPAARQVERLTPTLEKKFRGAGRGAGEFLGEVGLTALALGPLGVGKSLVGKALRGGVGGLAFATAGQPLAEDPYAIRAPIYTAFGGTAPLALGIIGRILGTAGKQLAKPQATKAAHDFLMRTSRGYAKFQTKLNVLEGNATKKLAGMIVDKPMRQAPGLSPITRLYLGVKQAWIDDLTMPKFLAQQANKALKKVGATSIPERDVELLLGLYPGRQVMGGEWIRREGRILAALGGFKGKHYKQFREMITCIHAAEREIQGIPNPGGLTAMEAAAKIKGLREKLSPRVWALFQKTERSFRELNDDFLKFWRDSGMCSQAEYVRMRSTSPHYAPFMMADYGPPPGESTFGGWTANNLFKAAKGARPEQKIVDPFVTLASKFPKLVNVGERNKIKLAIIDMLRTKEAGLEFLIEAAPEGAGPKAGWAVITALRGGKAERHFVPDFLADSLGRLTSRQVSATARFVNTIAVKPLRAGATSLYLPFSASNVLRDNQMAFMMNRYGIAHLPNQSAIGFLHAVANEFGVRTDLMNKYLQSGAALSGWVQRIRAATPSLRHEMRPAWKKLLLRAWNPLEYLSGLSGSVETATRLGIFRRVLNLTKNETLAAYASRKGTIDFAQAGTLMRVVNMWVPFLNARTQAIANVVRTARDAPARLAATIGPLVYAPELATWAWNKEMFPTEYGLIPEYVKDFNFVAVVGSEIDKQGKITVRYIKAPRGDLGQIFGNTMRYILEGMLADGDEETQKGLLQIITQTLSDISPLPFAREGELSATMLMAQATPPGARVAFEQAVNHELWRDQPIWKGQ